MVIRAKKEIDKLLRSIDVWDTITLSSLLKECKRPEFTEYVFHSTPYDCGCWGSCHHPLDKVGFFGRRMETDEEYNRRIAKEDADEVARRQKQEHAERETLARLKAKYQE